MKKAFTCMLFSMGVAAFGQLTSVYLEEDSSCSSVELHANFHNALASQIIVPRPQKPAWEQSPSNVTPSQEAGPTQSRQQESPWEQSPLQAPPPQGEVPAQPYEEGSNEGEFEWYSVYPEEPETPPVDYKAQRRAEREARREAIRQQRQAQRNANRPR